jgi:hypothetical protein
MNRPLTVSLANQALYGGLTSALAALVHLNDQGCTVRNVHLEPSRRPRIVILQPEGPFLQGVQRMRVRSGNGHRLVMSASVHGCQVEWVEVHALAVANG